MDTKPEREHIYHKWYCNFCNDKLEYVGLPELVPQVLQSWGWLRVGKVSFLYICPKCQPQRAAGEGE